MKMLKLLNYSKILAIFCFMVISLANADFPNDQQPCKFKDTKCLSERINYFLTNKFAGDNSINLAEIDPLKVPLVRIKTDSSSPVNVDLRLKNNLITGLKEAKLIAVSGFGPDMTESHELVFEVEHFRMMGDYTAKGKVVILPVTSTGNHDLNGDGVTLTLRFNGTPQQRDGATYMTIRNMSATINAQHVTYKFDNLFKGNKALSDNINSIINENWLGIWEEIRSNLADGLQPTIQKVFNDVFATLPYKEFFAEE